LWPGRKFAATTRDGENAFKMMALEPHSIPQTLCDQSINQ